MSQDVGGLAIFQKAALGVGALLLLVGGVVIARSVMEEDTKVEIITASPAVAGAVGDKGEIVVDVSGAVISPGVYRLPTGGRVGEALTAAGGLSAGADRDWVAKNINLAGKLVDGTKIYVPNRQESGSGKAGLPAAEAGSAGKINTASNLVSSSININTATSAELDTLPGIGPATATKIISNRPYQSVSELVEKKVVSQRVYDQIKDKVSVY
jgi:competence protein ComEA